MEKRVFLAVLVALLVLSLGACAPAPTGQPAATEAPVAGEAPAGETVNLRMWMHQSPSFNAATEALIVAYEKDHPNVKIALETFDYDTYIQTLQTAMPAGEEADIIHLFGTWTSEYAERLVPVPEDVMTLAQAQELYYAAPLGGFAVDGVLYGLPLEWGTTKMAPRPFMSPAFERKRKNFADHARRFGLIR